MESHLLQMRGLKPPCRVISTLAFFFVASFTDAWIETTYGNIQRQILYRRIFYRCVD